MKDQRRDRGSKRSPKDVRATDGMRLLEDLGDFYFSADAYPQALEQYKRALTDLPSEKAFDVSLQVARCHHAKGDYQDALEILAEIEQALGPNMDLPARGKLLAMYGHTYRALGQYTQAKESCEGAIEALRGTGEDREIAGVQLCFGAILHRLGHLDRARRLYEDALSAYRQIDDQTGAAMAFNNLGLVYMNLCRWDRAAEYLIEAREIAEVLGNYSKIAVRTANLGIIRFHQGRWAEAEQCFRKALRVYREIGYSRGIAKVSFELARLERVQRHWNQARSLIEEGLRLAEENGYKREISVGHEFLGELCCEVDCPDEAESHFSRGLEIAEAIAPQSDHISEICRRWAELAVSNRDPEKALSLGERALATAIRIQDRMEEGLSHRALGSAYGQMGDRERAREHFEKAVDDLRSCEEPLELARTLVAASAFFAAHPAQGTDPKAVNLVREARETFLQLQDSHGVGAASLQLAEILFKMDDLDDCLEVLEKAEELLGRTDDHARLARVAALTENIEERLLTEARSDRNRLALFARWGEDRDRSTAAMLKAAVEIARADRGFVARVDEGGDVDVEAAVGFEKRQAAHLLEELLAREGHSGARLILDMDRNWSDRSGGLRHPIKSYILLPVGADGMVGRWTYVDKVPGGSEGCFRKREVDLLVAFLEMAARDIDTRPVIESDLSSGAVASRCCTLEDVVTENQSLRGILKLVPKISRSNISVLLRGETGTGKQVLAEAIHSASDRCERPFVTVSCAALPEGLLETELFGHLKGAFTGAHRNKRGLIEEADGGTLFLDEIEKASVVVQGKLLRVLDTGELRPVGSTQSRSVDIRVICATSKMDLETEMREGRFLSDLFYRLNDVLLTLPPLRERKGDIPVLAEHFMEKYSGQMSRPIAGMDPKAMAVLEAYDWPGNVRELEKVIKLAVVLADDGEMITADLFPAEVTEGGDEARAFASEGDTLKNMVESVEREQILKALNDCGWNKSEASRVLGITRKGLANKIQRYGLKES